MHPTSSQPKFLVLGFLPVASRTWSRPSRTTFPCVLDSEMSVSFPSAPFWISVGVASGCRFSPCSSYCSATNLRTSSSKPLKGSGCNKQARFRR